MLVLSRQRDEELLVVDSISNQGAGGIMVVDIRGDKVRLGLGMPERYKIHRAEIVRANSSDLYDAIRQGRQLTPAMVQQLNVLYRRTG